MMTVWVLVLWNFFHVQVATLGTFPNDNACEVRKAGYDQPFRLPLGEWTQCIPITTQVPPPPPPPVMIPPPARHYR